jgi:hypothetical protein
MSEIAVQAASAKVKLLEIANQASTLAAGLQNAAPGDKDNPNTSIQYLIAIAEALASCAEECEDLAHPAAMPVDDESTRSGM